MNENKPWAKLKVSRKKYDTAKPWKRVNMTRKEFGELVVSMPQEVIDDLLEHAQADRLIESIFGAAAGAD
jgi:hypothetical protein